MNTGSRHSRQHDQLSPNDSGSHNRQPHPRRRLGKRAVGVLTALTIAIPGAGAVVKVTKETERYNNRVHAAQRAYNRRANIAQTAQQELQGAQFEASKSTLHHLEDDIEKPKLPEVKDAHGKLLGHEIATLGFYIPPYISAQEKARIKKLGAPLTAQDRKDLTADTWSARADGNTDTYDLDNFVKIPAKEYDGGDPNKSAYYVPVGDESQFEELCASLDVANKQALPGYHANMVHAQFQAAKAEDNLVGTLYAENTWAQIGRLVTLRHY